MLTVKDLVDSHTMLYKKDMIIVDLLGKNFVNIIVYRQY